MSIRKNCTDAKPCLQYPKAKRLKKEANRLQTTIRIGKNGLTDSLVEEIRCQLKKRKTVKVKLLKKGGEEMDKKVIAREIADKTGSRIIHSVGSTLTFHKP